MIDRQTKKEKFGMANGNGLIVDKDKAGVRAGDPSLMNDRPISWRFKKCHRQAYLDKYKKSGLSFMIDYLIVYANSASGGPL